MRAVHLERKVFTMKTGKFQRYGTALLCAMLAGTSHANAESPYSPYAGQETRATKALSPEDVQSYLAGKGMGSAKAAERNGCPGPAHVLTLADALSLSGEQRKRTEALFKTMENKAVALGRSLIEKERQLDLAFAEKSVTRDSLRQTLQGIALLQAQLRQAHLEAHLEQVNILTPAQISTYNTLRGYDQSGKASAHAGHTH
jgi:Spy/CpxP family protein refolding chaperone